MKEIIYNYEYLKDEDINNYVKRAKLVVENSNNEILLCRTNDAYYLLGGHIDGDESDNECLIREIKEEAGINFNPNVNKPFCTIKHYSKNYPHEGLNTKHISNYYMIKYDLVFDVNNLNLTEGEMLANFKLIYVKRDEVLQLLNNCLKNGNKRNVVKDTIDVMSEYLSRF